MTVHIKKRLTKKGEPRYLVYFRRGGGREAKTEYAGSFHKKFEAQHRRDLIAGELALGRDPRVLLAQLTSDQITEKKGLLERWEEFIDGRVDVAHQALAKYGNSRDKWVRILGADRDPQTITPADVQAGIAKMMEGIDGAPPLAASSITQYLSPLAMVLDFCDVDPNPARSPKVKRPRQTKSTLRPPASSEWFALRGHARRRSYLPLRLIECLGLRINECCNLTFGDIDFAQGQARIVNTKTVSGQRWLPVPQELLDDISDLCAPEDRSVTRRLFGKLDDDAIRRDMSNACVMAGISSHHPHELRHRRISLWYRNNFDPLRVKTWAGHARASMGLDVYGHVMLDPNDDEWQDFWNATYDQTTRRSSKEPDPRGAPGGHPRV